MANLAASAVTKIADYPLGDRFSKDRQESVVDFNVVLLAQGDGTNGNDILAAAFGMSVIRQVDNIVKSDNSIILVGAPKYDGSGILLKAAATNAPAQFSGTFNMRVRGRKL